MSRKQLLTYFKECVVMGAEVISEGCPDLPSPDQLFSAVRQERISNKGSDSSSTVASSLTVHSSEEDAESCVVINLKAQPNFYPLKKEPCVCIRCKGR